MKFKELIFNPKTKYIAATFIISAIGFFENFIVLKVFDLEKLGIVALSQTVITTISLMQFGVVTGGYRLFSYKSESIMKKINSAVLIFFIIFTLLLCTVGVFASVFLNIKINALLLFVLIIIGTISLYSNWVVCKLLATQNITILNRAQFIAALVTFFVTISAIWFGFYLFIVGLFIQPSITISIAYLGLPKLRPVFNFIYFKKFIKRIISQGFVPYLTSALTFFNSQLGRWLITFSLGTVILGKTVLVTLFVTLVSVFPNAISNLFFPSIIEKFEKNQKEGLKSTLKREFTIMGGYYILVILGTLLMANFLVNLFLPKQIGSINLLYAIAPSLVFLHLSVPAITLFNAAKKFNYILIGGSLSVISYCILIISYLILSKPQLIGFFIIESVSALIFFIYNSYYYTKINKSYSYA